MKLVVNTCGQLEQVVYIGGQPSARCACWPAWASVARSIVFPLQPACMMRPASFRRQHGWLRCLPGAVWHRPKLFVLLDSCGSVCACRTPLTAQSVGACMPMPSPGDTTTRTWHQELQPLAELGEADIATAVHEFQRVSAVWQSVEAGRSTTGAAYQFCYQGF